MKKNIMIILSIIGILMLSGCDKSPSTIYNMDDSSKAESIHIVGTVATALNETSDIIVLSEEDALMIKELWETGIWEDGTADCMDNIILTILSRPVYYHSDCGTFNDKENEKNLTPDSNTKEEINLILEKYIVLNSVERPAD